ncbi:MAG: NUDIX hydrolase [Evtepia sp.]
MNLTETLLETEQVYDGIIVNVRRDKVTLGDGTPANREVVEHPGGVAVFAIDDEERVILVRQFRYPMGEETLELPAGKLEKGEDPREAALRELEEETGLTPGAFYDMGVSYSSPGIFTEKIYIYFARNLKQGTAHPDEGELLKVIHMPLSELMELVEQGEIVDGKTLVGILKGTLFMRDGVVGE